jgi:hypothetical protein
MEEFELTGLDGQKYKVTASSREEAEQMLKEDQEAYFASRPNQFQRLPEGTETVPAGRGTAYITPQGQVGYFDEQYSTTDPDELSRIIGGADPASLFRERLSEDIVSQDVGRARASVAARGVPFVGEYTDELAGMIAGPRAEAEMRLRREAMEQTRPFESAALETATGIATSLPLAAYGGVGTISRGGVGRMVERAGQGAAAGAVEGAVSGYGAGEGETRAESARRRGSIGALIGGALGLPAGVVENIVEKAATKDIPRIAQAFGIDIDAAHVLANMVDAGANQKQVDQILRLMGAEARLANMGPQAKALLDVTQSVGGPAISTVSRGVESQQREVRNVFDRQLDDILGQPALGPKTVFRESAQRTAPKRSEAYELAYSERIPYSSRSGRMLTSVLDRVPDRIKEIAVRNANEMMQMDDVANRVQINIRDGAFESAPNMMQADYIKRGLGQIVEEGTDSVTGVLSPDAQSAKRLAAEISNALSNVSPQYGRAVKLGLDNIQESQAIRLVNNFGRSNIKVEDFVDLVTSVRGPAQDQLKESMKRMFRTHIQELEDRARATIANPEVDEESIQGAIAAFKELSSTSAKRKMRTFLSDREYNRIQRQLRRVQEVMDLSARTRVGSQTAIRQQTSQAVKELVPDTLNQQISRGEGINAAQAIFRNIFGMDERIPVERMQQILNEVADSLINTRGQQARENAELLLEVINGRSMTRENARRASSQVATGLWAGLSPTANEFMRDR